MDVSFKEEQVFNVIYYMSRFLIKREAFVEIAGNLESVILKPPCKFRVLPTEALVSHYSVVIPIVLQRNNKHSELTKKFQL